jgi:hypothetical protein
MAEAKYHDVVRARAFLKSAGLLNTRRVIEGSEREKVMTMLRLIGPGQESNNQHLWVESWVVGSVTYDHVTGSGIDELIEIIEDDI